MLTILYRYAIIGYMKTTTKRSKVAMSLKLDPELWDMLQALRKDMDRTQNWLIENALKQTYRKPHLDNVQRSELTVAN